MGIYFWLWSDFFFKAIFLKSSGQHGNFFSTVEQLCLFCFIKAQCWIMLLQSVMRETQKKFELFKQKSNLWASYYQPKCSTTELQTCESLGLCDKHDTLCMLLQIIKLCVDITVDKLNIMWSPIMHVISREIKATDVQCNNIMITISATSGSSGFGSAIRSCIDVSTVDMFNAGFHAP